MIYMNLDKEPLIVSLDMNTFYGKGIKSLEIIIKDKKYIFTTEQIEKFLKLLEEELKL